MPERKRSFAARLLGRFVDKDKEKDKLDHSAGIEKPAATELLHSLLLRKQSRQREDLDSVVTVKFDPGQKSDHKRVVFYPPPKKNCSCNPNEANLNR